MTGRLGGSLDVLTAGDQLLLPVDVRQQLVHHVQLLRVSQSGNQVTSIWFPEISIFVAKNLDANNTMFELNITF